MNKNYFLVMLAGVLYGMLTLSAGFFSKNGLSAFEAVIYPNILIVLIMLPILAKRKYRINRHALPLFAAYGLITAIEETSGFAAIALGVSVAMAALLIYSQPIWTTIFARAILREKITHRKVVAVAIAVFGTAIVVAPWNSSSISAAGIFFGLTSGAFLSLWVILVRKASIEKYRAATVILSSSAFNVLWLLLFWPLAGLAIKTPELLGFSPDVAFLLLPWLFAAAIVPRIVPYLIFYRGMHAVQASVAGVALLLEPVSAAVLAALLLQQSLGLNVVVGGALVLLSNYLVIKKK